MAWGELTQVARAAVRHDADLVHAPATLGPRKTRMPTVVTMQRHALLEPSGVHEHTALHCAGQMDGEGGGPHARRVITISPDSATEIAKYIGVRDDRLDVVPLAGRVVARGGRRRRAGEDGPLILAMGNRRPHKNWAALIRASALLPARASTPRRDQPGVAERILWPRSRASTTVASTVELRGWVDDAEVRDLYSTATALAIPSLAEGFSLPALEAMGAGCSRGCSANIGRPPVCRRRGGALLRPHDGRGAG